VLIDAMELERLRLVEHAHREFDTPIVPVPGAVEVRVDNLTKHFGNRLVLKNVSTTIGPGEFVAVVGRSGCGKSTLLRLIAGLESPDAGAGRAPIAIDDRALVGLHSATRIMFQEARLLPWKSVFDNVALGVSKTRYGEVGRALREVGLHDRGSDWPHTLSGGQRQRVALARALVHRPQLMLLDEPLGALDALTRIEMQRLIESVWVRDGFTAVLVTHDVAEAIALADRVLLIESGSIAFELEVDLPRPRRRGDAHFAALEAAVLDRVLGAGA
jgi:sulfonate transport system ATP-binding protein